MACVIERLGTEIKEGGWICHDERPSTYEAAEKITGVRLDRRRNYAIIDGQVCDLGRWSTACSGCYEGYDSTNSSGHGCRECGYTGRRREGMWLPLAATREASHG